MSELISNLTELLFEIGKLKQREQDGLKQIESLTANLEDEREKSRQLKIAVDKATDLLESAKKANSSLLELSLKQEDKLSQALDGLLFYADGRHYYESDYDEIKLECEGSSSVDHLVGKTARETIRQIKAEK